jgi:pyruvate kinase
VATLGPVSRNETTIRNLILAGANVFRFNYSHAEYDELEVAYKTVRRVSDELNRPVAILSDLQGPKFRVGFFEEGESIQLTQGQEVRFIYSLEKGNATTLPCNIRELVTALQVGNTLLLDDGNIELTVLRRETPEAVVCEVKNSGKLKERKGVNVPDIAIPVPAMTDKDRSDCQFALKQGTDFIALSFVQSAKDVNELRTFMAEQGLKPEEMPKIVCKIEKPQALEAFDEILEATDAIMVARGDLGVELRPEYVPSAQKRMIREANERNIPVITATQMLETMINKPVPTRAEVSDVANAIFDGTDAVMLSAETASGDYPVETVAMMTRIAVEAERHVDDCRLLQGDDNSAWDSPEPAIVLAQSIAQSAADAAEQCNVKAIVVFSNTGAMARRISKYKPKVPVIAITPDKLVYRTLALSFGVEPMLYTHADNTDATLRNIESVLLEQNKIAKGDTLVFCSGKTQLLGMSHSLKLHVVGQDAGNAADARLTASAVGV